MIVGQRGAAPQVYPLPTASATEPDGLTGEGAGGGISNIPPAACERHPPLAVGTKRADLREGRELLVL